MFSSALVQLLLCAGGADPAPNMDVVIRDVMIHDGAGNPGRRGDIALAGERIVGVGKFEIIGKPRIVDGTGLVAAPGFIDLHTHCDTGDNPITGDKGRANKCYLMQGVTLTVTGNCGSGPTDMNDYFGKLDKNGVGTNVIHQVPHNSVRTRAMGNANREPGGDEQRKMEADVEQMMKDGAWGLSTGLIYTPGTYSKTAEIVALAKIAAKHGGFYASHIRDEGTGLLVAIEEALRIGREANLPIHISHIKCSGRKAWEKSADAIALIDAARKNGQKVTADQYPYVASSTSLAATLIPTRFREGTAKEYRLRLDDPEKGAAIQKAIESALDGGQRAKSIHIARYRANPKWQGKTLAAIAEAEKLEPVALVMEIERNGGASIVNFGMKESDMLLFMKQPFVATASDGSSQIPGDTVPHPRSYGTFPRKIGVFSIEQEVIPLEKAIRSASGLPADILRLTDRGYLKPGYFADVVVFDPKTYRDQATFEKPHAYAAGVKYLFINGKTVIDDGVFKEVLAGKALRHQFAMKE